MRQALLLLLLQLVWLQQLLLSIGVRRLLRGGHEKGRFVGLLQQMQRRQLLHCLPAAAAAAAAAAYVVAAAGSSPPQQIPTLKKISNFFPSLGAGSRCTYTAAWP